MMTQYRSWSKADTHIHTTYSDGSATPEEVVDYVVQHTDLRVIAITDHDTAEGAFVARDYALRLNADIEVIIGQEVTTDDGDIIGLFLKSSLPSFETAEAAISAIHAQGGLAVAAHPFSRWATLTLMQGVGSRIVDLPLDAVEIRNGFPTNSISNRLTGWVNSTFGQNLCELGGSDSHVLYTIGQPFNWFIGDTAADLRSAIMDSSTLVKGTLWSPVSMARMVPTLMRSGLPSMADKAVQANESVVSQ
jgi:PHP domain-containing protein